MAGFIGSPAMNLAEGTVESTDGHLTVQLGSAKKFPIPDGALAEYPRVPDYAGRRVAVGLRPEHFGVPDQSTPRESVWEGRKVVLVELLGAEALVHFGTSAPPIISDDMREAIDDEDAFEDLKRQAKEGGQIFTARFEPHQVPKVGDLVDVSFRTDRLHFFDLDTGSALR